MKIKNKTGLIAITFFCAALLLGGCKPKEEPLPPGDKPEPVKQQKKEPGTQKPEAETEEPLKFTDTPDSGIRDIDFMNFIYRTEDGTLRFIAGAWSDPNYPDARGRVRNVEFGQLMGNEREQAVVSLIGNWGGGSLETGYIVVLDYHDNKAWQVDAFEGLEAKVEDNTLQVSRLDWDEGDPSYKPSLIITNIYRWTGREFKLESTKKVKK